MRATCRAWSESIATERRRVSAALFTGRALQALAKRATPFVQLTALSDGQLDHAASSFAASIGEMASGLPVAEGLHFLTSLYPALLDSSLRSSTGAFYTPPALADRLLDQATEAGLDWRSARVLDPAAGGAVFLIRAAQRIRTAMPDCEPVFALAQIESRLLGLEIDRFAAIIGQTALAISLADLLAKAGRPLVQIYRVCDTLDERPDPNFDLVIGNPPYGRVSLTAGQRLQYGRSLYGHANLYGVFTDIALRWAKPRGLIAYVTPASFLAGQYYRSLRRLLAECAPPVALDFVHARRGVFEDVLQETALALYQKAKKQERTQIHYLNLPSERHCEVTRNGTITLPPNPAAPWLAPRSPEHSALVTRVQEMTCRLSDWGYGVSTGPLVWNRYKSQLCHRPGGKSIHPLIWAECVSADGQFAFKAQKRSHAPYFRLESGDDWLVVSSPCVLVQRTTAKEQARRLIAAELSAEFVFRHDGVVIENHLNMVRPLHAKPKVEPGVVTALLNSRALDEVFRCMNGSVAVSAFELEALPLPQISNAKALARLVEREASRELVQRECDRLYGIAP